MIKHGSAFQLKILLSIGLKDLQVKSSSNTYYKISPKGMLKSWK
jgi:hypothetical protein